MRKLVLTIWVVDPLFDKDRTDGVDDDDRVLVYTRHLLDKRVLSATVSML